MIHCNSFYVWKIQDRNPTKVANWSEIFIIIVLKCFNLGNKAVSSQICNLTIE